MNTPTCCELCNLFAGYCKKPSCECHTKKASHTPESWEEVVKKLREPSNWLRQPRGKEWKDVVSEYSRVPFEAADFIETLAAERSTLREAVKELGIKNRNDLAESDDYQNALSDVLSLLKED